MAVFKPLTSTRPYDFYPVVSWHLCSNQWRYGSCFFNPKDSDQHESVFFPLCLIGMDCFPAELVIWDEILKQIYTSFKHLYLFIQFLADSHHRIF